MLVHGSLTGGKSGLGNVQANCQIQRDQVVRIACECLLVRDPGLKLSLRNGLYLKNSLIAGRQ